MATFGVWPKRLDGSSSAVIVSTSSHCESRYSRIRTWPGLSQPTTASPFGVTATTGRVPCTAKSAVTPGGIDTGTADAIASGAGRQSLRGSGLTGAGAWPAPESAEAYGPGVSSDGGSTAIAPHAQTTTLTRATRRTHPSLHRSSLVGSSLVPPSPANANADAPGTTRQPGRLLPSSSKSLHQGCLRFLLRSAALRVSSRPAPRPSFKHRRTIPPSSWWLVARTLACPPSPRPDSASNPPGTCRFRIDALARYCLPRLQPPSVAV